MNKELIEYLHQLGRTIDKIELKQENIPHLMQFEEPKQEKDLSVRLQEVNNATNKEEILSLAKEAQTKIKLKRDLKSETVLNQDLNLDLKLKQDEETLTRIIENLAPLEKNQQEINKKQEIKQENASLLNENKPVQKEIKEARANCLNYKNLPGEALEQLIYSSKYSAENSYNSTKIHISTFASTLNEYKKDKIVIDIYQVGENIKGNESSYHVVYDRDYFYNNGIMFFANEALISTDKVDEVYEDNYDASKRVETSNGHFLEIDSNVKGAIAQTNEYVNDRKPARVRKDETNDKATSNLIVFGLSLIILLIISYIIFQIYS